MYVCMYVCMYVYIYIYIYIYCIQDPLKVEVETCNPFCMPAAFNIGVGRRRWADPPRTPEVRIKAQGFGVSVLLLRL